MQSIPSTKYVILAFRAAAIQKQLGGLASVTRSQHIVMLIILCFAFLPVSHRLYTGPYICMSVFPSHCMYCATVMLYLYEGHPQDIAQKWQLSIDLFVVVVVSTKPYLGNSVICRTVRQTVWRTHSAYPQNLLRPDLFM
jgi:hypothetical protein